MTYLLDVNVLIALIDPTHVGHDAAHAWFGATFDRRLSPSPVRGGRAALHVIDAAP